MKPIAVTESPRTFWLSSLTAMYQMIDTTPIEIVDTVGVWKRGLTLPKAFGNAPHRAIDRLVRAVGRIVVCVDADADVSTAMISSLSSGEPSTLEASPPLKTSFWA